MERILLTGGLRGGAHHLDISSISCCSVEIYSYTCHHQMEQGIQKVRNDPEIRTVVLCSNVQGVFCAGADLKERKQMSEQEVWMTIIVCVPYSTYYNVMCFAAFAGPIFSAVFLQMHAAEYATFTC